MKKQIIVTIDIDDPAASPFAEVTDEHLVSFMRAALSNFAALDALKDPNKAMDVLRMAAKVTGSPWTVVNTREFENQD
jgi:hypothetical protein